MGQSLPTHKEVIDNAFKNNTEVRFYSKEQPNKLLILKIKPIENMQRKLAKLYIYSKEFKEKEIITFRYILITYTDSSSDLYEQLECCISDEYGVEALLADPLSLLYILINKKDA